MNIQTQDFRYHVVKNRFVVMDELEEFEWLYNLIEPKVKEVLGITDAANKQLYQFDNTNKDIKFQKLELKSLIDIATGLGIDCEACENAPNFFHLTDRFGNAHGFDIKDFSSRNQKLLNSFGDIVLNNLECGTSRFVPIQLPPYPDLTIGDALLIISSLPGLSCNVEVLDYTDPQYSKIVQKLHENAKQK
jgi:hypothetical protein